MAFQAFVLPKKREVHEGNNLAPCMKPLSACILLPSSSFCNGANAVNYRKQVDYPPVILGTGGHGDNMLRSILDGSDPQRPWQYFLHIQVVQLQ
ncbi:hypothetical protein MTYP_00155 [Methylophilaceae bacterium]|nr:hypothetical protein MTYP_00155 [Methylophilaceae bacterium]